MRLGLGFRVRVRGWGQHLDGAHAATEHSARYGIERRVGNKALLQKEGIEGRGERYELRYFGKQTRKVLPSVQNVRSPFLAPNLTTRQLL